MMAVAQYLIYFLVGTLFFLVTLGVLSVSAGVTFWGWVILFLPLFLAGYPSGLSFFYPRIAAIVSIILALPYFVYGSYGLVYGSYGIPLFVALAGMVILVSVFALLRSKTSLWSHQKETFGKVTIGIFAGLPALLATLILLFYLIRIGNFFLRRAT